MDFTLDLQRFAEDGTAAEPAGAGAETAAAESPITAGEELADGQKVTSQVAAEMNRQMAKHPELREVYGKGRKTAKPQAEAQPAEQTIEDRWNEAKKGEFAELYGKDVQAAVQERFKNQADANAKLNALGPMLEVLRERAGVTTDEELIRHVMDDDSLYEEAADQAGMTVEAYKTFKELEAQNAEMKAREEQSIQDQMMHQHFEKMMQQAEELKKQYPSFDLMKELENERFLKMTSPEGGISVADAYFAIHHNELAPQMLAYGMERAKEQMGQTIQARGRRPAEGAARKQGQAAADINLDVRSMKREERNRLYDLIHKGKLTWG